MILQISPDGEAVVGGPQLDLPVDKLMTLASGQVKELGETHGLRGLYLRNGPEFQVLYVTPDGRATIAGVMWDATGKNSNSRSGVEDRRRDSYGRGRQGRREVDRSGREERYSSQRREG